MYASERKKIHYLNDSSSLSISVMNVSIISSNIYFIEESVLNSIKLSKIPFRIFVRDLKTIGAFSLILGGNTSNALPFELSIP